MSNHYVLIPQELDLATLCSSFDRVKYSNVTTGLAKQQQKRRHLEADIIGSWFTHSNSLLVSAGGRRKLDSRSWITMNLGSPREAGHSG